ncbi:MAG: alpha-amylase family protein [Actinomycetes bacterium]
MTITVRAVADLAEQQLRAHLSDEADHVVDEVGARWRRWGPDLVRALHEVYPSGADELVEDVVARVAGAVRARRPPLRRRDAERVLQPDWFQLPDQVGYVAYADRFAGTLAGVGERVDYLRELGVTYLHLMPLLATRTDVDPQARGGDDGGYAVADFRRVRPHLGDTRDLADLADRLHEAGISLTVDLVLNHVAREHEWAVAARAGDERYAGYFHVFPDHTTPAAYERTLPEIFPDFAPGSFSQDPDLLGGRGGWVWTTFNTFQWDLNWSNPHVFAEMLDVVLHLANLGVDCLRLDAIAFIWKRMGTDCQGQPEVHTIVQALRAATRVAAPAVVFKAEAIVAPDKLTAYLGTGRHAGRVSDLAYHNSFMVQLWSALATGRADLTRRALSNRPPKPVSTGWATYVRCHDDIGWAIDDGDAAAVGLQGYAHRSFLSAFYSGRHPGTFARGLVFQHNPATGDSRISGSTASLAGLESALQSGDLHAVHLALGRIFMLHAAVYGFGGIPLLYSGDELALLNDASWASEPGHEADNRWVHRPRLPWDVAEQRHDEESVVGKVFAGVRHLARVRAGLACLHGAVESEPRDVGNDAVLALARRHPAGGLVQLYNLTPDWQRVPAGRVRSAGLQRFWEHLSSFAPATEPGASGDELALPPYAAWWLGERDEGRMPGGPRVV